MKSLIFTIPSSKNGFDRKKVGGFADRLKGACFCYLLACSMDRRFFIDWKQPFPLEQTLAPNGLNWIFDPATVPAGNEYCLDIVDEKFDNWVTYQLGNDVRGFEKRIGDPENLYVFCNSFPDDAVDKLKQFMQPEPKFSEPKDVFYEVFQYLFRYQFTDKYHRKIERFDAFRNRHEATVGLQFRTGKANNLWKDPAIDHPKNLKYLFKASVRTMKDCGVANYGVFLTTDNPAAKLSSYEHMPNERLFYFEDEPVHFERTAEQSHISHVDLFNQVILEFFILSSCDFIVCGAGGFGTTAAYSNRKPVIRYWDSIGFSGIPIRLQRTIRRMRGRLKRRIKNGKHHLLLLAKSIKRQLLRRVSHNKKR